MQATRRCAVNQDENNQLKLSIKLVEEKKNDDKVPEQPTKDAEPEEEGTSEDAVQLPTPPPTPLHNPEPESVKNDITHEKDIGNTKGSTTQDESTESNREEEKPKKPTDPLYLYGILLPPQLKQSQASFISAIEGPVGEAASTAHGLRKIEVEIRKLRKEIKKAGKKNTTVDKKEGELEA